MNKNIYSIYDSKTGVFNTPFFAMNNATAIRTFSDAANDTQTNINRHPEDFSLFHIGTYDEESGEVSPANHTNLGLATDYQHEQNT